MDPTSLADTIRNAVFTPTQFRAGYDEVAVDELLDEIVRAVERGSSGSEIANLAGNAKLAMTSMRRGYDCGGVDDLLDEVVRQATGVAAAPRPTPAPEPQERGGLGARLLRLMRGD